MRNLLVTLAIIFGCGLKPLKPLTPFGCDDLTAMCVCTADMECEWQWVCVSN